MKDLLSVADLAGDEIQLLLNEAEELKAGERLSSLSGKTLALLFEKPSLRTRVSFEMAMHQLGGHCLYLSPAEVGLGKRESVPDVARVLSRFVDIIAARTFSHATVEVLADNTGMPVINALSDREHPCQALADVLTIREKKGRLKGVTLAYIGDGNNVANSLMLAAALTGMDFRIASPAGYRVADDMLQLAQVYAAENQCRVTCTDDPRQAVECADVVYTDVWISMGQEEESDKRCRELGAYQINSELMSLAEDGAIILHPLPAHRGQEITDQMMEDPRAVVYDQAENRMHIAKALLLHMLGGLEISMAGCR